MPTRRKPPCLGCVRVHHVQTGFVRQRTKNSRSHYRRPASLLVLPAPLVPGLPPSAAAAAALLLPRRASAALSSSASRACRHSTSPAALPSNELHMHGRPRQGLDHATMGPALMATLRHIGRSCLLLVWIIIRSGGSGGQLRRKRSHSVHTATHGCMIRCTRMHAQEHWRPEFSVALACDLCLWGELPGPSSRHVRACVGVHASPHACAHLCSAVSSLPSSASTRAKAAERSMPCCFMRRCCLSVKALAMLGCVEWRLTGSWRVSVLTDCKAGRSLLSLTFSCLGRPCLTRSSLGGWLQQQRKRGQLGSIQHARGQDVCAEPCVAHTPRHTDL